MAFFEDPKKFRRRNVEVGRETTALRDARKFEFGEMLQGKKNEGQANFAKIVQDAMNERLASEQKYDLPLQKANIAKTAAETKGTKYFNELVGKYGEDAMRKAAGLEPLVEDDGLMIPGQDLFPKTDISSSTPGLPTTPDFEPASPFPRGGGGGGGFGGVEAPKPIAFTPLSPNSSIADILSNLGKKRKKDRFARSGAVAGVRG